MLPNSTILKGRYAEGAVRKKLESQGFNWTIRSYASHGPIDLLVSNGSELWAVQVKSARRNGGYLAAADIELLIQWSSRFNTKPVLAFMKKGKWIFKQFSSLESDSNSSQSENEVLSVLEELRESSAGYDGPLRLGDILMQRISGTRANLGWPFFVESAQPPVVRGA
jgi:Holliday junction resolvase